ATFHHHCVRTGDILRAMKFYSLLGLREKARFRTGRARGVWLCGPGGIRLEILEV
ncbi:unnamed protein product, partial [Phaeothamnion confervicola]